jgi:hypothetical protein
MPVKSYLSVDLATLFQGKLIFGLCWVVFLLYTPTITENVVSHYMKTFSFANFSSCLSPCLSVCRSPYPVFLCLFSLSVFCPVCLCPSVFRLTIFLPVCLLPVCISLCLSYSSFLNDCSSVLEF